VKKFFASILIFFSFGLLSNAQLNPQCNNVLGTVMAVPSGTYICNPLPLNPGISNVNETPITRCFSYQYLGPVRLSYLLVTGQCGPFPLYNQLSFSLYNAACDTLIVSGTIIPTQLNTYINYLTPGAWYVICYTWIPNCPQTAACPLIYTSLLPVELLDFKAVIVSNDIIIKWSTASQLNVDRFIIMKSYDGENWIIVDEVKGEGTTSSYNSYTINDSDLKIGRIYYKLMEVTTDGHLNDLGVTNVNQYKIPTDETYYDLAGKLVAKTGHGIYIVKNGEYYRIVYK
jgi:hypothetical protein